MSAKTGATGARGRRLVGRPDLAEWMSRNGRGREVAMAIPPSEEV